MCGAPETVAGLPGRRRTQEVRIVWHDSLDHVLVSDGLVLTEQRGLWTLERVVPDANTWLPAQQPPVVPDAPDRTKLPSPLAPLAVFEGRTASVHHMAKIPVTLTVENGILRAVAAEHPVARICLSGEDVAVRAAALLIADAVLVVVPPASVAAEAIAMATTRAPQPRHRGAPILPDSI